ncbi:Uncharacterised protein [Mycobacteroides abscessus]|nr:Uncharacterised protein [Mycobacteroides abscessus]CPS03560.1 Uncharacterised protein [Mycobacteroides abscessus]CPT04044.1 Uncharacterised protein [Mycobacteroides abscessus]CPU33307.1 Uncharacterised protein [Mycobacteroides abscessus]CPV11863.1 Uncharacterised protein [Mycobacteroides abscessus]
MRKRNYQGDLGFVPWPAAIKEYVPIPRLWILRGSLELQHDRSRAYLSPHPMPVDIERLHLEPSALLDGRADFIATYLATFGLETQVRADKGLNNLQLILAYRVDSRRVGKAVPHRLNLVKSSLERSKLGICFELAGYDKKQVNSFNVARSHLLFDELGDFWHGLLKKPSSDYIQNSLQVVERAKKLQGECRYVPATSHGVRCHIGDFSDTLSAPALKSDICR